MIDEYYGQRLPVQYAEITTEDGRREGIALVESRSILGFECVADEWKMTLQTFIMDELYPASLEQEPQSPTEMEEPPQAAGEEPPTQMEEPPQATGEEPPSLRGETPQASGGAVLHITKEDGTARLTYRFDGTTFRLIGWVIPGCQPVTVEGETLTYGEGDNAFSTVLPGGVTDWPYRAEDLPLNPEEALNRAAISEQSAADMFPGYTLRGYQSYNDGTMADAVYSRVTNGVLLIKRVGLTAGYEPRVTDCMPVPLSESLLTRLENEPFDDLIWCWLGGDTFQTQDAFSRADFPLPEEAVIKQNRIEENSLVVLAEVEGVKRLYVFERGGSVRVTQPLPEDVYIDFFHEGDGSIQFEWAQQNMTACFARRADGQWLLSWCTCYGPSMDIHFSANAFGVTYFDQEYNERMRIGTMASTDLFSIDLTDLNGAAPDLDQSGWAVVSNPDPADRLHLRAKADKSSGSLGKFYNGTPVRVLRRKGDWTEVQIGLGATAQTGWMMTKYLAFGADMDAVRDAFPELTFREEYEAENQLNGAYWVVGVEESGKTKLYILLGEDGMVTYAPQSWLWGGNG